jgi:hypothetical protein
MMLYYNSQIYYVVCPETELKNDRNKIIDIVYMYIAFLRGSSEI